MFRILKEKKVWLTILLCWILVALGLSSFAPGSKEQTSQMKNAGLPETTASIQAEKALKKYFPSDEGLPLFVVVHDKAGLKNQDIEKSISNIEKIANDSKKDLNVLPLSKMPKQAQASFFSEDKTTSFISVLFPKGMENKELKNTMDGLKDEVDKVAPSNLDIYFTGPAGIAADTYEMFSNADVVLILATVALIFIILIAIYRSPLLAFIPLIGAGITYSVVDRLIGLMGKYNWFTVDGQALSIMMILLFAVITDYSLLLFSRFREELEKGLPVNTAMKNALNFVKEPIIFSGSTVLLSMVTLFFAVYESYRGFAPVFVVAIALILIAGLTLMPALFAIAGEKSFWPSNPRKRAQKRAGKESFWHKIARFVTENPWKSLIPVLVVLILSITMVSKMNYTYNLLDSFPKDMSSVQGFKTLNEAFSEGEVAPSTVIVKAEKDLSSEQVQNLVKELGHQDSVANATVQGNPFAEKHQNVVKIKLVLKNNPYTEAAFDDMEQLRKDSNTILKDSKISDGKLLIAGETAQNTDIRNISNSDGMRVMVMVTILILIMLGIQTRSILAPIYMMGAILLSFGAALGISVLFFQTILGYDGFSYRIPLYTFVFLVALGVDYSIMLISRIREEKKLLPIKDAVREGVGKTGGVISSAGLILAATFAVLITQPVMELRVFGFAVAVGVLIDTFIVRPIAIPALIVKLGKHSFWPKKVK
ncbi:MMPL family transporter [Bacillus sp. 1P06AnD]|uniref:MMPL family transporter n=1 Tax=Bacillus sp. 1P06AnD TaxID=3132208 RepID=UPI00399FDDF2